MKLTNFELTNHFAPTLHQLAKIKTSPINAFKISKAINVVNENISVFNNARLSIIDNYCEKDEAGKFKENSETKEYIFKSDDEKLKCINEINELSNIEIELNINPVKLKDFNGTEMTAEMLFSLGEFITE